MAALYAGREGPAAWQDPEQTPCVTHHAVIQHSGIVSLFAYGAHKENL